jgi:hypothetical protein
VLVTFQLGRPLVPAVNRALRLLVAQDVEYLRRHPGTPDLYRSGVRYQMEPLGREEWLTIPDVLARGVGDCEDLAAWRAAELRAKGYGDAFAFGVEAGVLTHPTAGRVAVVHVLVSRDGSCDPSQVEDPSAELGMPPIPGADWTRAISAACTPRRRARARRTKPLPKVAGVARGCSETCDG